MAESFPETMDALCQAVEAYEASDLLLHENRSPLLRIAGDLRTLDATPLDRSFFRELWKACGAAETVQDHDASFTSPGGIRFRVNLLRQLGSHAAVLRRIRRDIPQLESIGVPAGVLRDWMVRKSGLVLVCGPTGSGKSTTLAACLEWMNQGLSRHIVSIEDPIEYLFSNQRCLFTQREVGIDTSGFAEGLRRSLRQSPDVIFVGEIRDAETAGTATQASETGHLVLATLHASSCTDAVERLQFLFPATLRDTVRRTLSGQLLGILCQRLLPALQGGMALAVEYFSNRVLPCESISPKGAWEIWRKSWPAPETSVPRAWCLRWPGWSAIASSRKRWPWPPRIIRKSCSGPCAGSVRPRRPPGDNLS